MTQYKIVKYCGYDEALLQGFQGTPERWEEIKESYNKDMVARFGADCPIDHTNILYGVTMVDNIRRNQRDVPKLNFPEKPTYPTMEALMAERPTGNLGDSCLVNGRTVVWSVAGGGKWMEIGSFLQGVINRNAGESESRGQSIIAISLYSVSVIHETKYGRVEQRFRRGNKQFNRSAKKLVKRFLKIKI